MKMNGDGFMKSCISALEMARSAELTIRAELDHIEEMRSIATQTKYANNDYSAAVIKKLELLERELNTSIDIAVDRKREALEVISGLDEMQRLILYRYYILGEEWETVADKVYVSLRQVYNIRKKALNELKLKYEEVQDSCIKEAI